MAIEFDLGLFRRQLGEKAANLQSVRQRNLIDVFCEHTQAEIDGDLDRLMPTMTANPAFHIYHGGGDIGPKGYDAVKAMYVQMFATHTNFMEMNYRRIIIDDDALMLEFIQRKIAPGQNFVRGPWVDALKAQGQSPDSDAHYMTEGQVTVIVPFDAQGLMIGEDAYTSGISTIRRLREGDLPKAYLACIAG